MAANLGFNVTLVTDVPLPMLELAVMVRLTALTAFIRIALPVCKMNFAGYTVAVIFCIFAGFHFEQVKLLI